MSIFGKKQKKEESTPNADTVAAVAPTAAAKPVVPTAAGEVIIRPHITEKGFAMSQRNVYTFVVHPDANKHEIKAAVRSIYNVSPEKVRVVKRPPRVVRSLMRARPMHRSGLAKAYVYLREGDTISFM